MKKDLMTLIYANQNLIQKVCDFYEWIFTKMNNKSFIAFTFQKTLQWNLSIK